MSSPHGHPHPHADTHATNDHEGHGHGHVVVSKRILVGVLLLLMMFTGLTVFAAQAEQFIAHTFNIEIPQWINVVVALSIAAVKTVIVGAFFMQLRYDNPVNSLTAILTLIVVVFFLGFVSIDLAGRPLVNPYKAEYKVPGGTWEADTSIADRARKLADQRIKSYVDEVAMAKAPGGVKPKPLPKHIVHFGHAQIERLKNATPPAPIPAHLVTFAELYPHHDDGHAHGHSAGHGGRGDDDASSPARSRVRTGVTLPEFSGKPADAAKPAGGH
jgi:caa(3)-type oxidase subunit IV